MDIVRIRVPSSFYRHAVDPRVGNDGYVIETADFKLGIGPCGKEVVRLIVNYHVYGVEIIQLCSCKEQKVFVYPWNQLTGRLEVTHG